MGRAQYLKVWRKALEERVVNCLTKKVWRLCMQGFTLCGDRQNRQLQSER